MGACKIHERVTMRECDKCELNFRVEKANVFQKRLVWDCMYKEEFIKVCAPCPRPSFVSTECKQSAIANAEICSWQ